MYAVNSLKDLLYPYLNGELDVKEAILVHSHLKKCCDCRNLYAREKEFLDLLKESSSLPLLTAPPEGTTHTSYKSFNTDRTDRWVYLISFLIPKYHREGIRGDLIEDRCELRSANVSRWFIEFSTVWQFIIIVLNSAMMVIRKILSPSKNS